MAMDREGSRDIWKGFQASLGIPLASVGTPGRSRAEMS